MRLDYSAPPCGERPLKRRTKKADQKQWRLRYATPKERANWDSLLVNNPDGGNFLQTSLFARFKQRDHWKAEYLVYETGDRQIVTLALSKYIFPLGTLWYFPKGPGIDSQEDLVRVANAIRRFVAKNNLNVFLVKVEPELPCRISKTTLRQIGFLQAQSIQSSTSTVIVPLDGTEQEIFDRFSKKARYGIRLGMREDIEVKEVEGSEQHFRAMYALMNTVAGGRGVPGIRPYEYYRDFWQSFTSSGLGKLYFVYENQLPVVGAFVVVTGSKAVYKDGGSDPHRHSKGASYLLQWYIMSEMKRLGITTYDMWGTPPKALIYAATHPLHGVSFFKTRFSKEVIDYCGVLDLVLSPAKYYIWRKWSYPLLFRVSRLFHSYFY